MPVSSALGIRVLLAMTPPGFSCLWHADTGRGSFVTPRAAAIPHRRLPRLRGPLAHDLARGLVEAHAEEGGMAQTAVGGPFHERDLCHQLGLDPRRGAWNALLGLKRGRLAHERGEALRQLAQRRAGEARPHLAGVAKAVAVEVADEQRTEVGARAARRREAADHELLRARALELQPVARARGHVRRAEALGDQPL